jgi:hypothetical protein
MNKTQNLEALIAKGNVYKNTHRDQYGRTVTEYSIRVYDEAKKSPTNPYGFVSSHVAVVVNLPKCSWERDGMKYLVNDWSVKGVGPDAVTYHEGRLDAHTTAVAAVIRASIK